MNNVLIEPTYETLGIKIYESDAVIELEGKSTLPNPIDFFKNVLTLFNSYSESVDRNTTINFKLTHLNTSSSKWIYYLLKSVESKYRRAPRFTVNWYYEEDDEIIQETGEIYKNLFAMPFNLIPVPEYE